MSDTTIGGEAAAVEPSERLHNDDLAPARERNWGTYSLFAMWMSDVHSIGGYTFAAGLFFTGLVGWQVFVALVLGMTAVFFLMNLTSFAGQATGVPYPVIARISFGVFGANLAALIRAVIAIAWYGIQGWNPKALIAGGAAAAFSLFVALYKPWENWSAFSWFVGVVIAALVYYLISAPDFRQPALESEEQGAQA